MIVRFFRFSYIAVFSLVVALSIFPHVASASFNQNNIMSDPAMSDYNSMTAEDIDRFLNSFTYSCISTDSGFSAKIPTGYNTSSGYLYGDFTSAGHVIYAAAQAYQINPRVLIATLEKEQSLVTGRSSSTFCGNTSDATSQKKYAAAAGYGCPDNVGSYSYSGISIYRRDGTEVTSIPVTCVNSSAKAGFSQQVIRAAWMLRYSQQRSLGNTGWAIISGSWDNSDDLSACYSGPMTQGTFKRCPNGTATYYDGKYTIDSTSIHLDTGATAALYRYTPHFHGNQLFVSIYEGWFGDTHLTSGQSSIISRYNELGGEAGTLGRATSGITCGIKDNGCYQNYQNGAILWSRYTGAWESKGGIRDRWSKLGAQDGSMGYPVSAEVFDGKGWWQSYQNGAIIGTSETGFWESKGGIRDRWSKLGYQTGSLGYPTSPEKYDGKGWSQTYERGSILGTSETGFWESKGGIRDRWSKLGAQDGSMGYPVSAEVFDGKGWWQSYQNGAIIGTSETGFWESKGGIRDRWSKLGYQTGSLGYPTSPEKYDGKGWSQTYERGSILGTSETGFWESTAPIYGRWQQLQGGVASLGYPTSAVICTLSGGGCYQNYQNGAILWEPGNGAWESYGGIRSRYLSLGLEKSALGYPTGGITCGIKNGGCYQNYQNGAILWEPGNGAWESYGDIRSRWVETGSESGYLGYPSSSVKCGLKNGGCLQNYRQGVIIGSSATGYWVSKGGIRELWARLNYENGSAGYPTGSETYNAQKNTWSQTYEKGTIYWSQTKGAWFTGN